MEYTLKDRGNKIIEECLQLTSNDPIEIFKFIARKEYVRMHGPEHHVLDGAALLTAYYNAGGNIDLQASLIELMNRALSMPGAMCGMWGVCGAVTSLGASLSIIENTGPLSKEDWGTHLKVASKALNRLAEIGGPRCCKRDAYLSFDEVIQYLNETYSMNLPITPIQCDFYDKNSQCIKNKCPFYPKKKVAFICVHNSCRSQIAEALGKHYLSDKYECYSAGTEVKDHINQDAVRLMKQLYGIDMESQYSKLITDIPTPDIMISMGCNVTCPCTTKPFDDDWGLDDPTGQSDEVFIQTIKQIEEKILQLLNQE